MIFNDDDLPVSHHFTLERVADGVYAALSREGVGAAMSNAGIVDLGDRTLVFDTCMTPLAAQDLRDAAQQLTGRPVSLVVNSHWHDDHVLGNQVFADAEILATERTRELILTRTAQSLARYQAKAPAHVRTLEERLSAASDDGERQRLEADLQFGRVIVASLPSLQLTPPTRTFATGLTLEGPRRKAELTTYGGGHTESDAFLYLPDDRLLFAGDLVVNQVHPWIGDGDPVRWQGILERLARLNVATLVLGHGPVGTRDAIVAIRRYLADVVALVTDSIERGFTDDQIDEVPIPEQYRGLGESAMFAHNVHFLSAYLSPGAEPNRG